MYYLLAGFLGFLLCGVWFGVQLGLNAVFSKAGRGRLAYFSPLMASCVPIALILRRSGSYSLNLSALSDAGLWGLSAATLLLTCLIKLLSERNRRRAEKRQLAYMCMEAAFVEIAQRLMMQSFVMNLLAAWGCGAAWCVPLNALVWCAGICAQAILLKQPLTKALAADLLTSFVFSIGCGYVFFRSGCIVFSMAAHAAERLITAKIVSSDS